MDKWINVKLLTHPMNYFTVAMMLIIAGIAGHLVLSFFGVEPTTTPNKSAYQPITQPSAAQSQQ